MFKFATDVYADQSIEIDRMNKMLEAYGHSYEVELMKSLIAGLFFATAARRWRVRHRGVAASQMKIGAAPPAAAAPARARPAAVPARRCEWRADAADAATPPPPPPPPPAVMPAPVAPIVSATTPIAGSARRPQGRPLGCRRGRVEHAHDLDDAADRQDRWARRTRTWRSAGKYAIQGNYNGFEIYDISKPAKPVLVQHVSVPGVAE